MKKLLIISLLIVVTSPYLLAQNKKPVIYGEVGLGFGQTLFFGDIQQKLRVALQANDFDPAIAGNMLLAFYVAPPKWKGFGLGGRLSFSGGGAATDDQGGEYFFNYYNFGISAKYYPISRVFDKGLYVRATLGTGQITTKHQFNDEEDRYLHQFAIGSALTGNVGWTFPLKNKSLSIEAVFEAGRRNGTISGLGDGQVFRSGQLGANLVLSF